MYISINFWWLWLSAFHEIQHVKDLVVMAYEYLIMAYEYLVMAYEYLAFIAIIAFLTLIDFIAVTWLTAINPGSADDLQVYKQSSECYRYNSKIINVLGQKNS